MSSNFLAELSNDYKKLFESEIAYDVIIYAGEEPNIKEIHAHSNILCIRSQYFNSAFSNEWAKKENGKFILKKENIEPHLFDIILRFIYCGNIELKNLHSLDVLKLLIAVDELNIQTLIFHVQEYLIEHKTEFLQQNSTDILETIYQHGAFKDLWSHFLKKICEEPKILFNSDKFINLKAPLLELLLKRDDLNMDEIEIWESLLKWFFAQQNMMNDPAKWDKEDITKTKRLLHRFLPLIRFYDVEPTDFFYKVYYYKDILPQDLIHELLKFYIVPNTKPKVIIPPSRKLKLDSTLIDQNHISLFTSWVDKKDYPPYEFKLIHRSNKDGFFDAASFHGDCDNKGATIWVAKIQGSTQLIGGYNPLDWNGNCGWKITADSFLFSFTDERDISTAKLGYINNRDFAIYCNNNQGPSMGNLEFHNTYNKYYYNSGTYYPNIGIPANFTVDGYEVFLVIKK